MLCLQYQDENNFYGWAMFQRFPVNNFEWIEDTSKFNENFIKKYNEESDQGYFLEVNVEYTENVNDFLNDWPLLPGKVKIEKVEKFVANLHNKAEYVIYIRNLKQSLNHGLVLQEFCRVIKISWNNCLKPYIV